MSNPAKKISQPSEAQPFEIPRLFAGKSSVKMDKKKRVVIPAEYRPPKTGTEALREEFLLKAEPDQHRIRVYPATSHPFGDDLIEIAMILKAIKNDSAGRLRISHQPFLDILLRNNPVREIAVVGLGESFALYAQPKWKEIEPELLAGAEKRYGELTNGPLTPATFPLQRP